MEEEILMVIGVFSISKILILLIIMAMTLTEDNERAENIRVFLRKDKSLILLESLLYANYFSKCFTHIKSFNRQSYSVM